MYVIETVNGQIVGGEFDLDDAVKTAHSQLEDDPKLETLTISKSVVTCTVERRLDGSIAVVRTGEQLAELLG